MKTCAQQMVPGRLLIDPLTQAAAREILRCAQSHIKPAVKQREIEFFLLKHEVMRKMQQHNQVKAWLRKVNGERPTP